MPTSSRPVPPCADGRQRDERRRAARRPQARQQHRRRHGRDLPHRGAPSPVEPHPVAVACAHPAQPPPAAPDPARGRAAAPQSSAVGPPIAHVVPVLTDDRDRRAVCRPQAPREGFPGRHARQAAARQVGGRRVWRGRILFLIMYKQTVCLCASRACCTHGCYTILHFIYRSSPSVI